MPVCVPVFGHKQDQLQSAHWGRCCFARLILSFHATPLHCCCFARLILSFHATPLHCCCTPRCLLHVLCWLILPFHATPLHCCCTPRGLLHVLHHRPAPRAYCRLSLRRTPLPSSATKGAHPVCLLTGVAPPSVCA